MPKVTEFVKFALQPELRCCRDRQCRHDRGAGQSFLMFSSTRARPSSRRSISTSGSATRPSCWTGPTVKWPGAGPAPLSNFRMAQAGWWCPRWSRSGMAACGRLRAADCPGGFSATGSTGSRPTLLQWRWARWCWLTAQARTLASPAGRRAQRRSWRLANLRTTSFTWSGTTAASGRRGWSWALLGCRLARRWWR